MPKHLGDVVGSRVLVGDDLVPLSRERRWCRVSFYSCQTVPLSKHYHTTELRPGCRGQGCTLRNAAEASARPSTSGHSGDVLGSGTVPLPRDTWEIASGSQIWTVVGIGWAQGSPHDAISISAQMLRFLFYLQHKAKVIEILNELDRAAHAIVWRSPFDTAVAVGVARPSAAIAGQAPVPMLLVPSRAQTRSGLGGGV